MNWKIKAASGIWVTAFAILAGARPEEPVDLEAIYRIKAEAFEHSKVMDHLFYLTDLYGPRLAGSPGYAAAADWVIRTSTGWGLANVHQEKWGVFGRSWSYTRFAAHVLKPVQTPLIGVPLAWTPGTSGAVTGEAMAVQIRGPEDFDKYKGKLRGKILFTQPPVALRLNTAADARRYTDAELTELTVAPVPAPPAQAQGSSAPPKTEEELRQARNRMNQYLNEEGVLAIARPASRGDFGTVFAGSGGSRDVNDTLPPTAIAFAAEHYNRIRRLLDRKVPVTLELDVTAQIDETPKDGFNIIAEIPGGAHKDEIVMIGAHLDSWQGGTGATDNGTGCAVMLEVMRILQTLHLKMDRTVRMALWDAEEEGLLGSHGYVKAHFADSETMEEKPEYAKLAAYFNLDYGGGKIRGVYLQRNDMVRPIFEEWLKPFKDLGATTLSSWKLSGTDHMSFDQAGLPGFQFIQDPLEYFTRTHHSNMDVYDRVQSEDLMQSAAIIASFVYHAATRPQMLPRKPRPPRPPQPLDGKPDGLAPPR